MTATTAPGVDPGDWRRGVADRSRRLRRDITAFKAVSLLVAAFLAFIAIYPLSRVILRLFVADGELDLSPFREVLELADLWSVLLATIVVVAISAAVALIVGSTLAWLLERTDARMGVVSAALPLMPFLLPPIAGAVGWVLLLSPRGGLLNAWIRSGLDRVGISLTEGPFDIYSWYGLIFAYTIYQIPYAYLMASAGLRNIDPALEEQSRVSGAGLWRTMWRVTLPAIKPSLGGAVLLMVWFGFALFSVPIIIGTGADIEVLSVRIVNLLKFTYPPQTELAVGLSVFVLLFVGTAYVFQLRLLRKGTHATVAGKGHRGAQVSLGFWRWPARLLILSYLAVAAILPILGLVLVSLNGFWAPNIDWGNLSLDSLKAAVIDDATTREALNHSLYLGVGGAAIGITAAAIVSLFVQRSRTVVGRIVDGMIKFPAAVSSIVLAVGFILAFAGPPFNLGGTLLMLLLAYLALYMPQASVAADVAAGQVGKELPEASHVCGAGGARTFLRVSLPLMLPGLVAGWALLFVRMVGDLTASSILAGTSNNVVGFRILEVFTHGSYAVLAALSTVLTLITSGVLILVLVLTRQTGAASVR